jgi:hypothetical protein
MKVSFRFVALVVLLSLCRIQSEEVCTAAGECASPDFDTNSEANNKETKPEGTFVAENENDDSCPSRAYVIKCAGQYLDTNRNGLLERAELQSAIDALPWYSRGIISILGSVDKMMKKCDMDGDGAISMDYDMKNNGESCLSTCFKRLAFKKAFFPNCSPESIK